MGNYNVFENNGKEYLVSYSTLVALKNENGEILLDPMWEYSRTTAKHVGKFLNSSASEIRKNIKCGGYKVEKIYLP